MTNDINLNNYIQLSCLPESNLDNVTITNDNANKSNSSTVYTTPSWTRTNQSSLDSIHLNLLNESFCESKSICAGLSLLFN